MSGARNPFKISQRFESYLEKHRIFELLEELSAMLLVKKPDDHLIFLKQSIYHAARRLDAPRIIILAPSKIDKQKVAKDLASKLEIPLITINEVVDDVNSMSSGGGKFNLENLKIVLMNYMKKNCDGWVFLDFPRNETEARRLQRAGMIPTHVIEMISSDPPPELFSKNEYDREIQGLRRVFAKFIKTIDVLNKNMDDVAEECLNIVKRREYTGGPKMFRILLIDTVDSVRCKSLGHHLAQVCSIIHIEFNEVLEKISLQDTDLGDRVQEAKEKKELHQLSCELKTEVFETFLIQSGALRKGWVLTGFVTNVDEFKYLDTTDSPPNRVIIIVSSNRGECENTPSSCDCKPPHVSERMCPNADRKVMVYEDIEDILEYAGESASIVEDVEDLESIKSNIETLAVQPAPFAPPRIPRPPPVIRPEDVEYDPDAEPSTEILRSIREPEPILPLI